MISAKKICYVAVFTALVVALSSFSLPVPGGHLYFNDTVICFASLTLDPLSAFIVGGVGAFLGDFFFYPAPMFVSLAAHGVQAVVISLITGGPRSFFDDGANFKKQKTPPLWRAIVALVAGAVPMVGGYTLGRTFVYGAKSWQVALVKLPFECLQATLGVVLAPILAYGSPLKGLFFERTPRKSLKGEKPRNDGRQG